MRDIDVRTVLRADVAAQFRGDPGTLVIDEMRLLNGDCRIDLAVVNGQLHGYEIKSDADTLLRLPMQCRAYSAVFDYVTLVVGSRHRERASEMVPYWWGVTVAIAGNAKPVTLEPARAGERNEAVNPVSLASLLWRDEILDLLGNIGAPRGYRSKRRVELYRLLADSMPLPQIQSAVRLALKQRTAWRPDAQRM